MPHRSKSLILIPAIIAAILAIGSMTARDSARPSDADRLKAEYLFTEALNARMTNNVTVSMLLLEQAAKLDPTDPVIAAELAHYLLTWQLGDSAEIEDAYNAVHRLFLTNPSDSRNGEHFARLALEAECFDDLLDTYRLLYAYHPGRTDYALEYAWQLSFMASQGDSAARDSVFAIYDRVEQISGLTLDLSIHRLRSLALLQDSARVIDELQRLSASSPGEAKTSLVVASAYSSLVDMPDSAAIYYDRACALDSTYGEAYLDRAEFYLGEGDSARYDEEVYRVLEMPTLDFEPKLKILTEYTRALYDDTTRTRRISEMFERMVEIHPGEPQLHGLYGAFLAAVDSIGGASEQFAYAIDLAPDNQEYWHLRMETAAMAGDTISAINTGLEASKRFTNDLFYSLYTSQLCYVSGQTRRALDVLDDFDVSNFKNNEALAIYHRQRADIFHALEMPDSALSEYRVALSFNPSDAMSMNNAAYFMACYGTDLDEAETLAVNALKLQPSNPTFVDTYAWVLFKKKKYTEAKLQIDLAMSIFENPADAADSDGELEEEQPSADIYDHAGDIYFMNGEPQQALQFWKKALEMDPSNDAIRKKVTHKTYFFE